MSIDNVVLWYEKNVNYKLTRAFLNFLVKTGIVKEDINLELLNLFLLEIYGNEFVKENNKFKIKKNRISVIDNFKDEKIIEKREERQKNNFKNVPVTITKQDDSKKSKNKFKIENLGGKRLKLVKL